MDAREQAQAYLDGELDAPARAQFEARMRAEPEVARIVASARTFHAFCKRACAQAVPEPAPAALKARILAGLEQAAAPASHAPAHTLVHDAHAGHDGGGVENGEDGGNGEAVRRVSPARRAISIWGPLMMAAAVMLVVTLAAFGQSMLLKLHCPYMLACAAEHTKIAQGNAPVAVQSNDVGTLTRYVEGVVHHRIPVIKGLHDEGMVPVAAGPASFASLDRYMATAKEKPSAAFVRYKCKAGSPCVVMLYHHWADETPDTATYDPATGFFVFDRKGQSVVCWRTPDGEMICSMVSQRPMEQVMALATEARTQQSTPAEAPPAEQKH